MRHIKIYEEYSDETQKSIDALSDLGIDIKEQKYPTRMKGTFSYIEISFMELLQGSSGIIKFGGRVSEETVKRSIMSAWCNIFGNYISDSEAYNEALEDIRFYEDRFGLSKKQLFGASFWVKFKFDQETGWTILAEDPETCFEEWENLKSDKSSKELDLDWNGEFKAFSSNGNGEIANAVGIDSIDFDEDIQVNLSDSGEIDFEFIEELDKKFPEVGDVERVLEDCMKELLVESGGAYVEYSYEILEKAGPLEHNYPEIEIEFYDFETL